MANTPLVAMNEAAANLNGMNADGTCNGVQKLELIVWWTTAGGQTSIHNTKTFNGGAWNINTSFGNQNGQIPFVVGRTLHWTLWRELGPNNWTQLAGGSTSLQ